MWQFPTTAIDFTTLVSPGTPGPIFSQVTVTYRRELNPAQPRELAESWKTEFDAKLLIPSGTKSDWSPDGSRLVFGRPGDKGISVLNIQTGAISHLTSLGRDP